MFTVPGNRVEQVRSCQYWIEVSCADFQGKRYTATFRPDPKPLEALKAFPTEQIRVGATQPEATSLGLPVPPKQS